MASRSRPKVVAFDVIETLFKLDPLAQRLSGAGLDGKLLPVWFAQVLRDGFALDATGVFKRFREVAISTLKVLMAEHGLEPDESTAEQVVQGFRQLPPQPDTKDAFDLLKRAGIRVVTLSNGSAESTQNLLKDAGLGNHVERVISIDEVGHWKPRREVYLHAATVCGVQPPELALVAAHGWDIHGAACAGLMTGWVWRNRHAFPQAMNPPDIKGESLVAVARQLADLR